VRRHYESELKATLWEKNRQTTRDLAGFDGRRDARFAGKRRNNTAPDWRVAERARAAGRLKRLPRGVNPASLAVRSNELAERTLPLPAREALLIVTLLNHPWLLEARCEEVAELGLTSPPLARLRDALLELLARSNALDRGEARSQLTALGLDKVIAMAERAITHRSDKFAQADTDPASVESGWRHALALHQAQFGVKRALDSAEREFRANPGDETWARIAELQKRLADGFEMEDTGAA
jgi:DNA primase